ncbi:MAG TPA: ABC transporter permease subunit [Clostridiaceae bacterium]
MFKKIKKLDIFKIVFIYPLALWMVIFVAIPLIYIIVISFAQRSASGEIVYSFNLRNYTTMISPLYFKVFFDSISLAFVSTLLALLFGYPFAYFIAKVKKRWRVILLLLVVIPFWTNSLIRIYGWMILLRTEGIINHFLLAIKLIHEPIKMLYSYGAVLVGMVYMLFPFMVLPLYNSIEKMDKSLTEASKDLGASRWKCFFTITLPLTMPGIVAGSILVFVPSIGLFFIPDLMGGGTVMLIGNLIRNQFLQARNWPFGAALSIVMIFVALLLIGVATKLLGKKVDLEVF